MNDSQSNISVEASDMEARYQQAQALLQGFCTKNLVQNDTLFPHWIESTDCFWYERATRLDKEPTVKIGKEFRLVDAKAAINAAAFDHDALAQALAQASDQTVDKEDLPISSVAINLAPLTVSFVAFDQHWLFTSDNKRCQAIEAPIIKMDEALSPDGKHIAFVRDYNLWLRDVGTGEEQAVTFDGEEDYAYGGSHTAWGAPVTIDEPSLWSADSTRLLTVLRDKRQVPTLPVIDHVPADGSVRPILHSTKVSYPGDEQVETFQLLAIDVVSGEICAPNYDPLPSGLNQNYGVFFTNTIRWAEDNRHAFFIALERGDQVMSLVEFDTHTGNTRVLFEEVSETHINVMTSDYISPSAHRLLASSNELIWWSERSGFGHLYLYDLTTGKLKQTITLGEWSVREVLHIDEQRREMLIQTAGRVSGRDPYYRDICRVQIDTGEITTVYAGDEDTCVHYPESTAVYDYKCTYRADAQTGGTSPSGEYIVITRSRVDQAPVSELLSRDGEIILELETTDVNSLPTGWTWPEPVEVMAADGTTPLYGALFRPSHFSPDKKYPVINHISGSPWMSMVPKGSFNSSRSSYTNMHYFHGAALAELGFIVLQLDSRGTALRSKAFQDESYGWIAGANNSEDHAEAIQQLAKRYTEMDINRVGSFCIAYQSGLINFLQRQDLYKVHVQAHLYEERFMGRTITGDIYNGCEGPADNKQNAEDLVGNLQGKLLLMHALYSDMAPCYPVAGQLRVIDALQKANKDFDMFMAPGNNPSYGAYMTRKTFDYFVKHLLGEEPPKEFSLETGFM